jgi:hypothetical protein
LKNRILPITTASRPLEILDDFTHGDVLATYFREVIPRGRTQPPKPPRLCPVPTSEDLTYAQQKESSRRNHAHGNPAAHRRSRISAVQLYNQFSSVQSPSLNVFLNLLAHRHSRFPRCFLNISERFVLR